MPNCLGIASTLRISFRHLNSSWRTAILWLGEQLGAWIGCEFCDVTGWFGFICLANKHISKASKNAGRSYCLVIKQASTPAQVLVLHAGAIWYYHCFLRDHLMARHVTRLAWERRGVGGTATAQIIWSC